MVTIIAPIKGENIAEARRRIEALGNPAVPAVAGEIEAVADAHPGAAIHFASLNVFDASAGGGHLVLEFSADGDAGAVLTALAGRLDHWLTPVFALASDRGSGPLDRYWRSHVVTVGQGFFDNIGVVFAGTPGLSVARIRRESSLVARVTELLSDQVPSTTSALVQLDAVREHLRADPYLSWALEAEAAEALNPEPSLIQALPGLALLAFKTYLWPLILPALIAFGVVLAMQGLTPPGFMRALSAALWAACLTVLAVLLALGVAYLVLRRREAGEVPEDRPPDPDLVGAIMDRENHASQNHLAALSVMKTGALRRFLLRVVLWLVGQVAGRLSRPGFLGTLSTIHFARWVMVPRTGDLLFLSNYDGSWESYLEDFITKAHNGLTAVWSNTVGFPKTSNLIGDGATDGARFKRWGRRQQIPTGLWYSAYPDLTTANIRTNAAIRQGIATILTEEEAGRWLSFFGSNARPASALEVNRIQSLVFGGLGFLRHGVCLGFRLSDRTPEARRWLAEVLPTVAFGDGRKHDKGAVTLGLSAAALSKLGLPADSVRTFPQAFLDGMCAPWRSRVLGDDGVNAPAGWWWGGPTKGVDGVLLVYAATRLTLRTLRKEMAGALAKHGHQLVILIPLQPIPDAPTSKGRQKAKREPFGFVDGVSQPIMRGTYKALRGADPIHIVEAGEFLLGYPDNRGYLPATPTLDAIHDPNNVLPIAAASQLGFARPIVNDPRDVGRNGTFLAIRQLEQDVAGFQDFCADVAERVRSRFPLWIGVSAEFIGAKLLGRWKDGSSLVRFPYRSSTADDGQEHPMLRTSKGTASSSALPALPPAAPPPMSSQAPPTNVRAEAPRSNVGVEALRSPRGGAPAESAVEPDNDFLFGAEDPQALRCPFGAHIRRANPRESFDPGSQEQLAITNRHRILRIGRLYQPFKGQRPGLFFMCLNADLERQFEFVQQTWAQQPSFHGLRGERDPLIGNRRDGDSFTIPTREGPVRLTGLPSFVQTRGGGYFFLPGKSLLDYLST
jgi:deferrochelatase/peroxidase EfeB